MTEAYPLKWPAGWERTERRKRKSAAFRTGFVQARQNLLTEIKRLGGTYPIISTNLATRRDGLPYANTSEPDDTGVAVYFKLGNDQKVLACDKWNTVRDNMQAIAKTIENLRSNERYGVSEMLKRSLAAFDALPAPTSWRDTFKGCRTAEDIHREFRRQAKECHPDNGGNASAFAKLTEHYDLAKREMEKANA